MTQPSLVTECVYAVGAAGFLLLVTQPPHRGAAPTWARRARAAASATARRLRFPVLAGFTATAATRWPAVGILTVLVVWSLPVLIADTKKAREARLARREAVAKWLEMLADGFGSGGWLESTVLSTERSAPPAVEAEVKRLCSRLRGEDGSEAPWAFDRAVAAFADEFADRDVDRAMIALVDAAHGSARTLSRVVRKAAALMRERVAVDRRIESGPRARIYLEVRFTEGLMALVGLVVLLRLPVLRPLGTPTGQLYMLVVGAVALLLLRSLARLAAPPEQKRLLVVTEEPW